MGRLLLLMTAGRKQAKLREAELDKRLMDEYSVSCGA
jgi:hypothetical protein